MTILVPLMLFGWIPFTVILFCNLKPHRAVLISVIGGILFLPQTGYDLSGLPVYTKQTAIALGIILGGQLSGKRSTFVFKITRLDVPMLIWCLCPIFSSLSNGLGLYDGLSSTFDQTIIWGVPYFAGRIYFRDIASVRDLCYGIVIGGLLYMPLCLYEVRMSPQLSKDLYGFFPHSWRQHFRYGSFRPIVFMQHGLMVSFWMAASSVVMFWIWQNKQLRYIKGVPVSVVFLSLAVTCMICKSVNGFFALFVGCSLYFVRGREGSRSVTWLLLLIPLYLFFRMNEIVTATDLLEIAGGYLDEERVHSFSVRLIQENLFFERALDRPWFGWGGYSRGKPIDPETGKEMSIVIDSLWIIVMRSRGFVGLIALFSAMLIGPWMVLRRIKRCPGVTEDDLLLVVLSLIVTLFMIDSLQNGMLNSVFFLTSGVLLSYFVNSDKLLKPGPNV